MPTVMIQIPRVYSVDHDMKQFDKAITMTDAQRTRILELVTARYQQTNALIAEYKAADKIVGKYKKKGPDAPEIQSIPLIQDYRALSATPDPARAQSPQARPDGQDNHTANQGSQPGGRDPGHPGGGLAGKPSDPDHLLASAARMKLGLIRNEAVAKIFPALSEEQQKSYREWMLKHALDELQEQNNDFVFVNTSNLLNAVANDGGSNMGGGRM